jgi:NitT/TauT family transport system substrate-binding protein
MKPCRLPFAFVSSVRCRRVSCRGSTRRLLGRPAVGWLSLMAGGLLLLGCGRGAREPSGGVVDDSGKARIRLELNWFPEAEHGGYYAALVHGFFAEEGLEVTIVPGGPNVPVLQNVALGKSDFGVNNADQILFAREADADLVALFAPLQDSPRCILVHADAGIRRFEDLKNVVLAVGSSSAFFRYLARQLPLDGVELVAYSGSIAPFLTQPRFAQQAYVFSEPYLAEQEGVAVHCLMVSELGYNPYTSVLFTSRAWLERHPDLTERLVRAVARGWQQYLEDPALTNDYIARQNPEISSGALAYGAREIAKLCLPAGTEPDQLGRMTAARWEELANQMVEAELLRGEASVARDAFTTRFLPAADHSTAGDSPERLGSAAP